MSKDYEVGYCRPPKHTQYKKGQTGNPAGSKRGKRGLKTDLIAELNAKETVRFNGRPVTGRRQQLAVQALTLRAASGDLKALQLLMPLIVQVLGIEDRGGAKEQLSAADQALLEEVIGAANEEGRPEVSNANNDEQLARNGNNT